MWKWATVSLFVASFLLGCTTVPYLTPTQKILPGDIVDAVECELKTAVLVHRARLIREHRDVSSNWFMGWIAGFELSLQVDEESGVAIDSSYGTPIGAMDKLVLGLSGGISGKASRVMSLKASMPVSTFLDYDCPLPPTAYGDLGIREWVAIAIDAIRDNDVVEHADSFGQNLEFTLKGDGKVAPGFTVAKFTGPGSFSASRSHVHSVNLAFAPSDKDKKDNNSARSTKVGPGAQEAIDRTLYTNKLQQLLRPNLLLR
jgi:hypothetical protein